MIGFKNRVPLKAYLRTNGVPREIELPIGSVTSEVLLYSEGIRMGWEIETDWFYATFNTSTVLAFFEEV